MKVLNNHLNYLLLNPCKRTEYLPQHNTYVFCPGKSQFQYQIHLYGICNYKQQIQLKIDRFPLEKKHDSQISMDYKNLGNQLKGEQGHYEIHSNEIRNILKVS